jgi:thioredoxin reductase
MPYDVVIAGGGPAGLAAALTLGRARKRILLCDAGPPRNAAATHVHNFVTRDGTPPAEFRRIARQQLERYAGVETREVRVDEVAGERGGFQVRLTSGRVDARRVLLCTGMVDALPDVDGFRELWGRSIFICPYCHAWEVQDGRFAYLASNVEALQFPLLLRSWTSHVVALTDARFAVPPETRAQLAAAGVGLEERRIARLRANGDRLERIEFAEGEPLMRDVLFAHPAQRQVALVRSLGLALDAKGYIQVSEMHETSKPGIYAGGDLITPVQGAALAAASGMRAAATLNHSLTAEMAAAGLLG